MKDTCKKLLYPKTARRLSWQSFNTGRQDLGLLTTESIESSLRPSSIL